MWIFPLPQIYSVHLTCLLHFSFKDFRYEDLRLFLDYFQNCFVIVYWQIDNDSAFYNMTPRDILAAQFEVVITLEGVTEETGNTIQVGETIH
jgi:hypothetical protein